ncbi:MAG TPA: MFS transporter, partial [Alicyclobacillus sp.]|nr:MFS transporter [Alicyclobacillus sp.]
MVLFSNMGCGGLTTFDSSYALSRHVQPILAYSLVFSGALLIFRPLAGRLYDRRGLAAVLVPVLVILAAGFGVLAAAKDLTMFPVAA